jgi:hypothetical protein
MTGKPQYPVASLEDHVDRRRSDGALVPVVVDVEQHVVTYVEPNVWLAHPVT